MLGAFLEGFPVQLAIMGLLILDVACVIGEISLGVVCSPELASLQAQLDAATAHTPNATADHSSSGAAAGGNHHRMLRGAARALESAHGAAHSSVVHDVEHVLHIASLSILSVFAAHLFGLMVAFGIRNFAHHCFYVLDLVVVTVAIILESIEAPAGEIVVVLLFWRLLRIGHGVFASELVAVERVQHTRHRLHAVRKRLFAARSYTATRLRLTLMRTAATLIVRWWRERKAGGSPEAGGEEGGPALPAPSEAVRRMRMALRGDLADEALEDAATHVRLGPGAALPRDERAEAARRGLTAADLDERAEAETEGEAGDADDVDPIMHGDSSMPLRRAGKADGASQRRVRRPLHRALDALDMDSCDLVETPGASSP